MLLYQPIIVKLQYIQKLPRADSIDTVGNEDNIYRLVMDLRWFLISFIFEKCRSFEATVIGNVKIILIVMYRFRNVKFNFFSYMCFSISLTFTLLLIYNSIPFNSFYNSITFKSNSVNFDSEFSHFLKFIIGNMYVVLIFDNL